MTLRSRLGDFRKSLRIARDIQNNVNLAANEELFWDYYVNEWEQTGKSRDLPFVGSEFKREEGFLRMLKKYSSPEKTALEVGCGGGRITATGVKLFKHVYATDISTEMLRKAKEAITAQNVTFHKSDGFTLKEFADETIDYVYSHDVFVQISSIQVYPYLIEIKRILKNGGIGLVSDLDFVGQFELFKEWSLKFWNNRWPPVYRRVHFVTEEMLRTMLSDLELEVLEVRNDNFVIVAFGKK